MILWDRVKKSFDSGADTIKRTAMAVSDRARIEAAVARLLIEKGSAETRLARTNKELGERVYSLWSQGSDSPMGDQEVLRALREIESLNAQLEELNEKVRKVSLGEEME